MNQNTLQETAQAMVAPGRGLLAADESTGTIKKRFDKIGVENTEPNRQAYRDLLFTTPDFEKHTSGVILFEETLFQSSLAGQPFPKLLASKGVIPGIKVDAGAKPLPFGKPEETITEGLDGLRERLVKYREAGARFAKWRALITIGNGAPSYNAIQSNAHALGRYAALCQEAGIVPIVEPEVLMDGDNTAEVNEEVTTWILKETFQQLYFQNVLLEGIILKPNMIVSGIKCPTQAGVAEVAERTLRVLRRCVPSAVPGIAFLSGGQADELATAHLDAMNKIGNLPWKLTFSYGRALQAAAQKAWGGKNVEAGKAAHLHRARMNGLAALGKWDKSLEKA
ncbi:fructose-bisphosphate aldolase [Panacagrimonas perspica]|uniref:Fructose-bisphosphate aldolase n=1 Tax=Panacagrimonas perspica TaxID=381431 RepID=A0A4S3K193_9GAMM|nr:class I fructose-bisphosphate aldolase [Panacagrimonas perspica]TDU30793.1 fructose-bisphosphate aldolase [Panacagrimonas perspica]THD01608.1 fructose-bisphosphate aldolase [Panacagrimonas perspica]